MSFKSIFFAAILACGTLGAATAKTDTPLGHPSMAVPDRIVQLSADKQVSIHVKRFETIRFTDGETTVTWTFDTLGTPVIPLDKIFPTAMGTIYVEESTWYSY